jgi:hypothetical protein
VLQKVDEQYQYAKRMEGLKSLVSQKYFKNEEKKEKLSLLRRLYNFIKAIIKY